MENQPAFDLLVQFVLVILFMLYGFSLIVTKDTKLATKIIKIVLKQLKKFLKFVWKKITN